jgi:hypothetical protein
MFLNLSIKLLHLIMKKDLIPHNQLQILLKFRRYPITTYDSLNPMFNLFLYLLKHAIIFNTVRISIVDLGSEELIDELILRLVHFCFKVL